MIEENFDPKRSIREYVNEDELKFEITMMNLSQRIKHIDTLTEDEILEKYKAENDKRIVYYNKQINSGDLTDIGVTALKQNIVYVNNLMLTPPTRKELIQLKFEAVKDKYREFLVQEIQAEEITKFRRDYLTKDLLYLDDIKLTAAYSKERFGKMLMLIIKNLAVKPSFSGYTDNWKDEFFGNAIEKVLLYSHNFDEELLSKRTGKKSKAFAYITQICFNAFIAVINDRKRDQKLLKDMVPYETIDGFKPFVNEAPDNTIKDDEMIEPNIYECSFEVPAGAGGDLTDIVEYFQAQLDFVIKQNAIFDKNTMLKGEIEMAERTTPQEQRDKDYIAYVRDLEFQVDVCEFIADVRTIRLIYPKNMNLTEDIANKILNSTPNYIQVEIKQFSDAPVAKVEFQEPEADLIFGGEITEDEW